MKNNTLIRGVQLFLIVLAGIFSSATSAQQVWPSKPIRVIVPFAAGGATDQVARLISIHLSTQLGVPVVVENKPGANGAIGADLVAKSGADGYTLLHSTSSLAFSVAFKLPVSYDLTKDLVPVSFAVNQPLLIMASLQSGVTNQQTLRQFIKGKEQKLNYGSAGTGNLTHLAMYVVLQGIGVDAVHIPYKGGAGAFPDFIAGRLDLFADPINSAYPYVRDKRVTALAVTSEKRSSLLPDIPTVSESFVPGFSMGAWQALFAPANTPTDVVDKISKAYRTALNDSEIKARLATQGAEAIGSTPDELKAFLNLEINRWEKLVQSSGIKID
ncbi:MAG: tripartite tricarboxylate transporter substrate binding protein [Alcaligenaceae bacterium]